ncbi:DUF6615 family protein [Sphingobacterium zeae]|uniref:DUF6615 family protein n=1 Tax=Sphingobacterium zeae TaxID=1776859 RepID=UPI00361EF234
MSLEYYLNLRDSAIPNVCDVFKAVSRDAWARIYFSRKTPRLKIHETSITQNIVYQMNLLKERFPSLGFDLYESANEKAHGDDLELTISQDDGNYVTYAIQSKIIYHRRKGGKAKFEDGYYDRLNHWVGKDEKRKAQVDLLLSYANEHGFIPLYMLYNYVNSKEIKSNVDNELFGCTVVNANYHKINHTINGNLDNKLTFSFLHPKNGFPWHELICGNPNILSQLNNNNLTSLNQLSSSLVNYFQTLSLSDQWKEIDLSYPKIYDDKKDQDVPYLQEYTNDELQQADKEDVPIVFLPKFKIVIHQTKS